MRRKPKAACRRPHGIWVRRPFVRMRRCTCDSMEEDVTPCHWQNRPKCLAAINRVQDFRRQLRLHPCALIALLLAFGTGTASDDLSIALVVLAATLVGTVACLATMWWLMRPLRHLATAITHYRRDGLFLEEHLNRRGNDEIAVVTRAVCGMVGEIAALAERVDGQPALDPLTGLMNGSAAYGVQVERMSVRGKPLTVAVFELEALRRFKFSGPGRCPIWFWSQSVISCERILDHGRLQRACLQAPSSCFLQETDPTASMRAARVCAGRLPNSKSGRSLAAACAPHSGLRSVETRRAWRSRAQGGHGAVSCARHAPDGLEALTL